MVRTRDFQSRNTGSTPVGTTTGIDKIIVICYNTNSTIKWYIWCSVKSPEGQKVRHKMKRVFLTIILIVLLSTTVVQARGFRRPRVVHLSPRIHREPVVVHSPIYRRPPIVVHMSPRVVHLGRSYGYYGRGYGLYGHDPGLIVGSIAVDVLDMFLQDKQNTRAMDMAEREQNARIAQEEAVRKEAERQEMFQKATELKAKQKAKEKEAENEELRQEIQRLRLEFEKQKLLKELEKETQKQTQTQK